MPILTDDAMTQKQHQDALARQIGQVHAKILKQYHARILCKSLISMLKAKRLCLG
jgi:hypothetical protein